MKWASVDDKILEKRKRKLLSPALSALAALVLRSPSARISPAEARARSSVATGGGGAMCRLPSGSRWLRPSAEAAGGEVAEVEVDGVDGIVAASSPLSSSSLAVVVVADGDDGDGSSPRPSSPRDVGISKAETGTTRTRKSETKRSAVARK